MRLLALALRRIAVALLGVLAVWLIAYVFQLTDHRLPTLLSLAATYAVAAYVVLPRIVLMSLKLLKRGAVPSFTLTGDGFPGDPVNLALVGAFADLEAAFTRAGWVKADPLGLKSSWGMAVSFVLDRPYPTAPFSSLYLFGRRQDVGFQKAIDKSPRKRHHIRFWALSPDRARRRTRRNSGSTPTVRRWTSPPCGSAPARATPGSRSPNSPSSSPTPPTTTPTPSATSSSKSSRAPARSVSLSGIGRASG